MNDVWRRDSCDLISVSDLVQKRSSEIYALLFALVMSRFRQYTLPNIPLVSELLNARAFSL